MVNGWYDGKYFVVRLSKFRSIKEVVKVLLWT